MYMKKRRLAPALSFTQSSLRVPRQKEPQRSV
jgi:hypothetical protein